MCFYRNCRKTCMCFIWFLFRAYLKQVFIYGENHLLQCKYTSVQVPDNRGSNMNSMIEYNSIYSICTYFAIDIVLEFIYYAPTYIFNYCYRTKMPIASSPEELELRIILNNKYLYFMLMIIKYVSVESTVTVYQKKKKKLWR